MILGWGLLPSAIFSNHPFTNISMCHHSSHSISADIKEFCQVRSAGHRGVTEPWGCHKGTWRWRAVSVHTLGPGAQEIFWLHLQLWSVLGTDAGDCGAGEDATNSVQLSEFDLLMLLLFVLILLGHCHSQLADWALEATTRKSLFGILK